MELKNVICETSEQFHAEVEKWQKKGAAPIIRGRKLIAYGETVAELVTTRRGGSREGAGRPKNDRNVSVSVRITKEAFDALNENTDNKSEYIDTLIKMNTTMPITYLSKNIRTIEHIYVVNNHRCLEYAVLYTINGEERFVGYVRSNTLDAVVGETHDYTDIIRRYNQDAQMPEWVKEAIGQ